MTKYRIKIRVIIKTFESYFSMANLLAKFRIDFSDMIIIPEVAKKASDHSKEEFDQLIANLRAKNDIDARDNYGMDILTFSFYLDS